MRKANLENNIDGCMKDIQRYHDFMKRIISAKHTVGKSQDKQDIAESVILRLCANWESFVEEHLIDCVNVDSSKLSEYFGVKIPKHLGMDICQALLIKDGYMDFRSFDDLKGFSKKILLDNSNPFQKITKQHSEKIDEAYKMRNYLSHYSIKAKKNLMKMYQDKYMMSNFLEPGQFLLAYSADRLWKYFGAFEGALNNMKKITLMTQKFKRRNH